MGKGGSKDASCLLGIVSTENESGKMTDTRDGFEAHFQLCDRQRKQYKDGGYVDSFIQMRWEGWQAQGPRIAELEARTTPPNVLAWTRLYKDLQEREQIITEQAAANTNMLTALQTICALTPDDSSTDWNEALKNCQRAICKATGQPEPDYQ